MGIIAQDLYDFSQRFELRVQFVSLIKALRTQGVRRKEREERGRGRQRKIIIIIEMS